MTFWVPGFQSQQSSCLCPSHVNLHWGGKHCEIRAGVRTHCLIKPWLQLPAEVQTKFLFLSCLWGPAVSLSLTPSPCPNPPLLSCLKSCSLPGCVTDTPTLQGLGKACWNSIPCTSYLAAWDGTKVVFSLLSGTAIQGERNVQHKRETPGVCFLMKPCISPDWIAENTQDCNSSEILF